MAVLDVKSLRVDSCFLQLPYVFYSRVALEPLKNPYMVEFNSDATRLIDIEPRGVSPDALINDLFVLR